MVTTLHQLIGYQVITMTPILMLRIYLLVTLLLLVATAVLRGVAGCALIRLPHWRQDPMPPDVSCCHGVTPQGEDGIGIA